MVETLKNIFRPLYRLINKVIENITYVIFTMIYQISGYQFLFLDSERIGHFSLSEAALRQNAKESKKPKIIGIYRRKVANDFLLKMFKRNIFCFCNNYFESFLEKSIFLSASFSKKGARSSATFSEHKILPPALSFTAEEELTGKQELAEMGLKENDWFVCFHVRDEAYLRHHFPNQSWGHHHYRNGSLDNLMPAIDYITQMGGFALRMGQLTESKLDSANPKIIDYANRFHSEFMDVYLISHCRFFLGSTSGLSNLSVIFNRPHMIVNYGPMTVIKELSFDLFLPLKIKNKSTGKILTFQEMKNNNYFKLSAQNEFDKLNLEIVENTSDEILFATKEFYQLITSGKSEYVTELSEKLHQQFATIFEIQNRQLHGKISRSFLEKNAQQLF